MLQWLRCLVQQHRDHLIVEPSALRVECVECRRQSAGIDMDDSRVRAQWRRERSWLQTRRALSARLH